MNIIKEGVRSALVRLVRYLVFFIIILAIAWVIGIISNKKASALVIKDQVFVPAPQVSSQAFYFDSSYENHWFDFNFSSNWTNTSDFDLIGFRYKTLSYIGTSMPTPSTGNVSTDIVDNSLTFTGVLWDSNGAAQLCYTSSEIDNVFLCPIQKNVSYKGFSVVVNTADILEIGYNISIYMDFEQNANFYNYDSSDIINYLSQNGNIQIVQQQQITNTTLTQTFEFIQQNDEQAVNSSTTGSLNSISSQFNDLLNGWGGEWSTLTHVVFEPVQLLVNITDTENTCQPLRLKIPYVSNSSWGDYYIDLPCMGNIYNGFFSTFMSIFATVVTGMYGYRAIIYFMSTIKGVLDAEDDKIEVINL